MQVYVVNMHNPENWIIYMPLKQSSVIHAKSDKLFENYKDHCAHLAHLCAPKLLNTHVAFH